MRGRPGRRTPWCLADGLDEALALAADRSDVLVVDLENTLVPYGSTAAHRVAAIDAAVAAVAAHGGIRHLAVVSNARFRLPPAAAAGLTCTVVRAARKPHLWCPPLRALRPALAGATVYGDQPLTDGLLAHHLGGLWVQPRPATLAGADEPWWPRLMRARGRRVLRRSFAPVPGPGSPG